ncbi:hypothetical protein [Shewanella sp.]|uniref:hypothetical protein n=1 Tax=Shewanella sp. TaxID=50422 RepID=UPI003D0EE094
MMMAYAGFIMLLLLVLLLYAIKDRLRVAVINARIKLASLLLKGIAEQIGLPPNEAVTDTSPVICHDELFSKVVKLNDNLYSINRGAPFELVFSHCTFEQMELIRNTLLTGSEYDNFKIYMLCYFFLNKEIKCETFEIYKLDTLKNFELFFDNYKVQDKKISNTVELSSLENEALVDFVKNSKTSMDMIDAARMWKDIILNKNIVIYKLFNISDNFEEDCYYFRFLHTRNTCGAVHITSDDFHYHKWNRAVKDGFAVKGYDIPSSKLIEVLNVSEINSLFSDVLERKFTRSNAAKEYALSSNDFKDRFFSIYSSREYYALTSENIEDSNNVFSYYFKVSSLILTAITVSESNLLSLNNMKNELKLIKCNLCAEKNITLTYDKKLKSAPPYYFGCECCLR